MPGWSPPWIPFVDGGEFAVRRVLCIGRNYAAHAAEMGADTRQPPCHFSKGPDAIRVCDDDSVVAMPPRTSELHHEIELVVLIGAEGRDLTPDTAWDVVAGYAVGVDLTRRDVQRHAKENRWPWEAAKDFDDAGPVTPAVRAASAGRLTSGRIQLSVGGSLRQDGDLSQMVWSVPELLADLSSWRTLRPGDVVFTGTPAGVGPLVVGDQVEGRIDGLPVLRFAVGGPR